MFKVILDVLTLNEKRLEILKLMIFPCAIVYFGYYYTDYISSISGNIPNLNVFDRIYEVLFSFLKLINIISWVAILLIIIISILHYAIQKVNRKKVTYESIFYLRITVFKKVLYWLLETSAWHLVLMAIIILIKNPTNTYVEDMLWNENLFLTLPAFLFVVLWIFQWSYYTKFGVDEDYRDK